MTKRETTIEKHSRVYKRYLELSTKRIFKEGRRYMMAEEDIYNEIGREFFYAPATVKTIIYKQKNGNLAAK